MKVTDITPERLLTALHAIQTNTAPMNGDDTGDYMVKLIQDPIVAPLFAQLINEYSKRLGVGGFAATCLITTGMALACFASEAESHDAPASA